MSGMMSLSFGIVKDLIVACACCYCFDLVVCSERFFFFFFFFFFGGDEVMKGTKMVYVRGLVRPRDV